MVADLPPLNAPTEALHQAATGAALAHPALRVWASYWQRQQHTFPPIALL